MPATAAPRPRATARPDALVVSANRPHPLTPIADAAVDGDAVLFAWAAVPDADGYQLQVAADEAFTDLRFDAPIDTTHLTLFSHFATDGAQYYWRLRHRTGDTWHAWTGPAVFRSLTTRALTGLIEAESAAGRPLPVSPVAGAPVDGSAADFHWTAALNADTYRLQVATDPACTRLLADVPVPNAATSLMLYGRLPETSVRLYWRVAAGLDPDAWSAPVPFLATTDDAAARFGVEQEKTLNAAAERAEWQAHLDYIEHMGVTETTSATTVLFVMLTLLFSLIFTVFCLFVATM